MSDSKSATTQSADSLLISKSQSDYYGHKSEAESTCESELDVIEGSQSDGEEVSNKIWNDSSDTDDSNSFVSHHSHSATYEKHLFYTKRDHSPSNDLHETSGSDHNSTYQMIAEEQNSEEEANKMVTFPLYFFFKFYLNSLSNLLWE